MTVPSRTDVDCAPCDVEFNGDLSPRFERMRERCTSTIGKTIGKTIRKDVS